MLLENSEKYIVSSNVLYKLSNFIEFSLDYLQLSYEVLFEDKLIKYIDISTGKTFIESDAKQFRKHDLRGIQGDNSKLINCNRLETKVKIRRNMQKNDRL